MTLWLRTVAALVEDPGMVLSTHIRELTAICHSNSRKSDTLPSPPGHQQASGPQTYMQSNTHTHKR